MSQSVQVSTLQERVRVLCGLPAYTTDTPITSAGILDFIRTSLVELGGIIKEYSDEQLLTSYGTVTTVPGVAVVSLPVGTSDLVRVAWLKSPTEELQLTWASVDEWQADPQYGGDGWDGWSPVRYRMQGANTIELYPTPKAAFTLRLHYTTGIYITAASDTVVMRDGWDQWVVFNACMLVRMTQQKTAEDMSPASFVAQRDAVEARIRREMRRDRFGPRHVRDSRQGEQDRLMRRKYWYP